MAPYVPEMTESELMALITGGMATVSGTVLGGYIALGIHPYHLLAVSFMAAPASLVMAKMMVPETSSSKTAGGVSFKIERTSANLIDALARGASQGVRLALNIAAMLIAFVAMVYLVNGILATASRVVGVDDLLGMTPTLQLILGYLTGAAGLPHGGPLGGESSGGPIDRSEGSSERVCGLPGSGSRERVARPKVRVDCHLRPLRLR